MIKKSTYLLLFLLSMNYNSVTICGTSIFYYAPEVIGTPPIINGTINEAAWNCANITLLSRYYDEFATVWSPWNTWAHYNDAFIKWRAVWQGNKIYVAADITDNFPDYDNISDYLINGDCSNVNEDDALHLFFKNQTNAGNKTWTWGVDRNFLIGPVNSGLFFVQQLAGGSFIAGSGPNFVCGQAPSPPPPPPNTHWFIEAEITGTNFPSGTTYSVGQHVWFQIAFYDADQNNNGVFIERDHQLAFDNGVIGGQTGPIWNWLDKMILIAGDATTKNTYIPPEIESDSLDLNGEISNQEDDALPVIFGSSAGIDEEWNWADWKAPSDVSVIYRAFCNKNRKSLYFNFKFFDDSKIDSNFMNQVNLINDDGLLIMIDFNKNGVYDGIGSKDVNVFVHSRGNVFEFDGFDYDTPYSGDSINVAIGPLDNDPNNWIAEVEVPIPDEFFDSENEFTIDVELGFNDADSVYADSASRQHVLVWSTSIPGIQPWKDFSNLGKFIINSDLTDIAPDVYKHPSNYNLSQNYPNPFNSQTSINYSLKIKGHVTIQVYDVLGRPINTLVDQIVAAGDHQISWDATNLNQKPVASGIYFVAMKINDFKQVRKMILIR